MGLYAWPVSHFNTEPGSPHPSGGCREIREAGTLKQEDEFRWMII